MKWILVSVLFYSDGGIASHMPVVTFDTQVVCENERARLEGSLNSKITARTKFVCANQIAYANAK